jgi:hypothetical protein
VTQAEFKSTLKNPAPPTNLSVELEALWHDGKGDWNKSHDVIQDVNTRNAAWIHAYLHRKEGDRGNAQYWYAKAERSMVTVSLEEEWNSLVEYFLKETGNKPQNR